MSRLECWDPRRPPEVSCDYFSTVLVRGGVRAPAGFELLIVIEGAGTLNGEPARAGEVWYVDRERVEIGGELSVLAASAD